MPAMCVSASSVKRTLIWSYVRFISELGDFVVCRKAGLAGFQVMPDATYGFRLVGAQAIMALFAGDVGEERVYRRVLLVFRQFAERFDGFIKQSRHTDSISVC